MSGSDDLSANRCSSINGVLPPVSLIGGGFRGVTGGNFRIDRGLSWAMTKAHIADHGVSVSSGNTGLAGAPPPFSEYFFIVTLLGNPHD